MIPPSSAAGMFKSSNHRNLLKSSLAAFDQTHVIHPYTYLNKREILPEVVSASGAYLTLKDGSTVIDGISSWWACIHGFRRKELNDVLIDQATNKMSHVMFGGLTHRPACELVARILDLFPQPADENRKLSQVFLCDSGSVSVEVAMKIALQYFASKEQYQKSQSTRKDRFLTTRNGYHGDTFLPMSVSDPINGMHHLFHGVLTEQIFVSPPACVHNKCKEKCNCATIIEMEKELENNPRIAGVILEPIFQGAGAMSFYSPALLKAIRGLCDKFGVPLILDEIATGFGRTGELFACEHAEILPDIMCIGKALTGGYLTMGATIISNRIANGIQSPLMHGPTFMANPLACSIACASIDLLASSDWKKNVKQIENLFKEGLQPVLTEFPKVVKDVRVLGAIAVVEFHDALSVETKKEMTETLIKKGVWLRPFSNFLYAMPPFNASLSDREIKIICEAMRQAVQIMATSATDQSPTKKLKTEDPVTFV